MKKLTLFFLLAAGLYSCVSNAEYKKLQNENEMLISQLDECQNGEDRLIAEVKKFYSEKNYLSAKEKIKLLNENHPQSVANNEFKTLLVAIEAEEAKEAKRKEAEEKERIRIANLNNTGIWTVSYYVDDFGEPTKEGYIRNADFIEGTFSNTATHDSPLNVKFLISSSTEIDLMLYEYANNNPVKSYSSDWYTVLVQDKDENRYKIQAVNRSDRLRFNKEGSSIIHKCLMKGGTIKFRIVEDETPTTQYNFNIIKADWYDNAYTKLKES